MQPKTGHAAGLIALVAFAACVEACSNDAPTPERRGQPGGDPEQPEAPSADTPNDFGNAGDDVVVVPGPRAPSVPNECRSDEGVDDDFTLPVCELMAPPDSFEPELQWQAEIGNGFGPPLVANMTDDNGDGRIDLCDTPDVVVLAGFEPADLFMGKLLPTGGRVYVFDGATGEVQFATEKTVQPTVTPAVGDIDGDGLPEIVAVGWTLDQFLNGEMLTGLVAFDHMGKVQWSVPLAFDTFADQRGSFSVSLHDMDGDGSVEVIMSTAVFDGETGALKWNAVDSSLSLSSLAVDLDGDGTLELTTGLQAFDHTGQLVWNRMDLVQGNGLLADLINLVGVYPVVVNFDDDPEPEIVLAAGPGIYVLEHDGTTKLDAAGNPLSYRTALQGINLGEFNPPTAHDFDGDGSVDIAIGALGGFTVLNRNLEPIYQYTMIDQGLTATTAFDFLGDGQAEAIYADKDELLVFDVARQALVMTWPHSGALDYPVVADVDNDGSAEIVVVSGGVVDTSQLLPIWVPKTAPTVQVLTDVEDRWIPTRRVWNMANYHVTNVLEDGRIPAKQVAHYARTNTFRTNVQYEAGGVCAPPGPD